MVALPLLDVVLASDRAERSIEIARQMIDNALLDLRQIQMMEDSLAPAGLTHFDRQTVTILRGMYEHWVDEARPILHRLNETAKRFGKIERVDELRDALGVTLAMLSISIDDMEAGTREIAEGKVITSEEARRAIRLRAQ